MKKSSLVTKVVAYFAIPWAKHVMFLSGRNETDDNFGLLVHTTGFPVCFGMGRLVETFEFYEISSFLNFNLGTILTVLLSAPSVLLTSRYYLFKAK